MRDLINKLTQIEEGYFSELDIQHQEEAMRWIKRNRQGELNPAEVKRLGRESFQAGKRGDITPEAAEHVFKMLRKEYEEMEPLFPKDFDDGQWAQDYATKHGTFASRRGNMDYYVDEGLNEEQLDEISSKLAKAYLKKTAPGSEDAETIDAELEKAMLDPKYPLDPKITRRAFGRVIGRMNAKDRKGFMGWLRRRAMKQGLEESEIEFLQYPEGYEPEPLPERHPLDSLEWMMKGVPDDVIQMMKSLEHKIKVHDLWDKGVELAGGEDQLWNSIQYEAEDIMDSYRDSGEGIGSSDMNYFVRSIFRDIGEDDVWGWDKPREGIEEDYHQIPREKIKRFANLVYNIEGGIMQRLLLKGRGLSRDAAEKKLVNDGFTVAEISELESWLKKAIENVAGEENILMQPSENNFGGWSHVTWSDDESGMQGIGLKLETEKEFNRKVMDEFKKIAWVQPGMGIAKEESRMLELAGIKLDEEVVEVPAGLRGEEGSHLSTRDAEEFIDSLGPEDTPDTEVIDPDSGDVLDWPDTATRRDQEERAERERREKEEAEAEDTPMLYSFDLKPHGFEAWDRINQFRYDEEFTDHYDVEWRNMEDLVDNPDQYYEGDYDIGVDMPVKISRKDGKKFDKQDRENFKQLYKIFRIATYNISVAYAGSSDDGTVAHFYPTFF